MWITKPRITPIIQTSTSCLCYMPDRNYYNYYNFVFRLGGSVRFYYNNFALVSLPVQQKTLSLHLEPYKLGH